MDPRGHFRTVWPVVRHRLRPWTAPPSEPWSLEIGDARFGAVRLTGRLTRADPRRVLVMLHGLGGHGDSAYQHRAGEAAARLGLSLFRFEMRGADRSGEDIYHAGLSGDLAAALASPQLRGFEALYLLGFSLGGHLALHYATGRVDPRLRAVAAVCSPIELASTVDDFDRRRRLPYRRYVLRALKTLYRPVAARRAMAHPLARVLAVRTLREWDEVTVVPRFGFGSTAAYYAEAAVARRLGDLKRPALLVAGEDDPMVTADSVRRGLRRVRHDLRVEWAAGAGHVGFPRGFDFGQEAPRGLDHQVLAWLLEHACHG